MIAHPPCTHLAVSGQNWFSRGLKDPQLREEALIFVQELLNADIKHIALENPISIISTRIRKPSQIIQPYEYGHPVSKKTCLWLKNLPLLTPTKIVEPEWVICKSKKNKTGYSRYSGTALLPPSPDRARLRSITYQGIAEAMAEQWSKYIINQNNT